MSIATAWELFDKAASFDEKSRDSTLGENVRRVAAKGAERKLDEAVAAEAAALAMGERHAA